MAVLAQDLRNSILQAAMQGKLTEQLESDSSAKEFLNKIHSIRNELIKNKEIKKVNVSDIDLEDVPFEIPSNWEWDRIGNIEEINLGFTYKPEYVDDGVYFLSVKDISGGKIDFANAKKVSQQTYDNASYGSKPKRGDILFGRVCTMGKPQIIETDVPFCIFVSLGFFRDHSNLMNKKYVAYWMESQLFTQQVNMNVKGAAQKNLNTGWLKDFFIPIPPIEEQKRIVEKLEEILPQIDEYEKTEMKLEALKKEFPAEMVKSLFQAACQGKLTKQLETDSNVTSLFEELNITEYDGANPYEIPDTWKFAELEDLVSYTIKRGKSPKYVDKSNVYVFAQKCNLKYGTLSLAEAKYLDEKTLSKYNNEDYLQDKDIVINSTGGGTMGRVKMFDISIVPDGMKIVPDSHVTTVRIKEGLNKDYIYYIIKNMQPYLESKGVGSTNQKELKPDVIKGLVIPIPPIEEQQRIVEKLDNILPHCSTLI